jgi:hypothetical protein
MDHDKSAGKNGEGLSSIKFRCLANIFMESCDYDEIPLRKILYFVKGMVLLAKYSRW